MRNATEPEPAILFLSRKGFDSVYGGCASPILPDGQLVSLPIPQTDGRIRYRDLHPRGIDIGQLVSDLNRAKL